jgi:hypothetical protein
MRVQLGFCSNEKEYSVVFVPGAADVVALFEDDEVVEAGFFEFDGHAEAGEAGADDGDLCGLCHCCTPVWPVWPCLLLSGWSSLTGRHMYTAMGRHLYTPERVFGLG